MSPEAVRSLIAVAVIFALFYFLIFRPQMKRQKQRQKLIKDVKVGDKIVTIGGIYGTIKKLDELTMLVEVAKDVELTMSRAAIGEKVEALEEMEKEAEK